jgi:hypothetical protein
MSALAAEQTLALATQNGCLTLILISESKFPRLVNASAIPTRPAGACLVVSAAGNAVMVDEVPEKVRDWKVHLHFLDSRPVQVAL